jgi:hypothetical protein
MNKAKRIENSKSLWTEDNDLEDYVNTYGDNLYKLRYYIFKHRENLNIYEPLSKCKSFDNKEILLFDKYIYARLELDDKFACTNYRKNIATQDLLSLGQFETDCIKTIANLIKRDNQIMEHWKRTLHKLETSLKYWITERIPSVLKNEISRNASNHYTSINGIKDKKIYMDTLKKDSALIQKSKLSFVYLQEVRKLYSKILGQLNKFSNYKMILSKKELKKCSDDEIMLKGPFKKYFDIWPNEIQIEDDINLEKFFTDILSNLDIPIELTTEEAISNNNVYNNYLRWLSNYKQTISGKVTQTTLDTILPKHYINLARNVAKENQKKKNLK